MLVTTNLVDMVLILNSFHGEKKLVVQYVGKDSMKIVLKSILWKVIVGKHVLKNVFLPQSLSDLFIDMLY